MSTLSFILSSFQLSKEWIFQGVVVPIQIGGGAAPTFSLPGWGLVQRVKQALEAVSYWSQHNGAFKWNPGRRAAQGFSIENSEICQEVECYSCLWTLSPEGDRIRSHFARRNCVRCPFMSKGSLAILPMWTIQVCELLPDTSSWAKLLWPRRVEESSAEHMTVPSWSISSAGNKTVSRF